MMVHDLAHYGAGTTIAEAFDIAFSKSDLKTWQKVIIETSLSCVGTIIYEGIEQNPTGIAEERVVCGTLGGLICATEINIKF